MSNYAVARLEEIDVIDDGRSPFRPVRHHFGIESFGVNTWTAKEAGDRLINDHDEAGPDGGHEELYIVLSGHARFEIDGETVDAPAGTFVYAKPSAKRTAFAEEAGTTLVALGGTAGKAYTVQGWEAWAPLNRYYQAGEYAEAAERGRALADAHPEYPGLLYNVACCEALAGDKEHAIAHLRTALTSKNVGSLAELAKTDTDFDSLRDEPAFKELVG
jgi:tetratricopeptide (TPR) repeat protein